MTFALPPYDRDGNLAFNGFQDPRPEICRLQAKMPRWVYTRKNQSLDALENEPEIRQHLAKKGSTVAFSRGTEYDLAQNQNSRK